MGGVQSRFTDKALPVAEHPIGVLLIVKDVHNALMVGRGNSVGPKRGNAMATMLACGAMGRQTYCLGVKTRVMADAMESKVLCMQKCVYASFSSTSDFFAFFFLGLSTLAFFSFVVLIFFGFSAFFSLTRGMSVTKSPEKYSRKSSLA